MKHFLGLLFLAAGSWAQTQPLPIPDQSLLYYSGLNLQYICKAQASQVRSSTITVSAVSNASTAVVTATGHGLDYQGGATVLPSVTVTGGTLNWLPFNGTWTVTPTSANAFTIPVDTTAFGSVTGTLVFTTLAPRTTLSMWMIQKMVYDGSNNLIAMMTGRVVPGVGTTTPVGPGNSANQICANRAAATMSYQ